MISTTYTDEFGQWLRDRNRSQVTVALYEGHLRRSFAFSDPLAPILDARFSLKTRHSILAALRAWAKFTADEKLQKRLNDIRETLPKAERMFVKVPLSQEERDRFLDTLDSSKEIPPVRAVLGMMASRGLRIGDVLRLTRKEVTRGVEEGVLSGYAKGGKRKTYDITKGCVPYLELLLEERGWTTVNDFIAPDSGDDRAAASQIVRRACARIGKAAKIKQKVRPHLLRATFARLYLDSVGGDVTYLTKYMGWDSVQTALGYVEHVNKGRMLAAADGIERKKK
jgi:integrase